MSDATLTRRALSYGAEDTITGHPEKVYTESDIIGCIQQKGYSKTFGYSIYPYTAYIPDVIHEGDQIEDAFNTLYEVNHVTESTHLDQFDGYVCELVKLQTDNRAATSGTWHLDTSSLTTDSRSRHKIYLDTYIIAANLKKDDGVTNASKGVWFDNIDIKMKDIFNNSVLAKDVLALIGKEPATSLLTYDNRPYGFLESVPINIYAVNKSDVTATNLIEQFEQEIRRIVTTYPIVEGSSLRSIQSTKHSPVDLGNNMMLWNTTVTIKYKRINHEYTPTGTLTWGDGITGGTFTFPNIIHYVNPFGPRDNFADMPGRQGDYPFLLGSKSDTIDITCDLDIGDWKRPQANPIKTDSISWQVFKDITTNAGIAEVSQALSVAGEVHAVRLKANLDLSPDQHRITLHFTEYNPSPASSSYTLRHGIL